MNKVKPTRAIMLTDRFYSAFSYQFLNDVMKSEGKQQGLVEEHRGGWDSEEAGSVPYIL